MDIGLLSQSPRITSESVHNESLTTGSTVFIKKVRQTRNEFPHLVGQCGCIIDVPIHPHNDYRVTIFGFDGEYSLQAPALQIAESKSESVFPTKFEVDNEDIKANLLEESVVKELIDEFKDFKKNSFKKTIRISATPNVGRLGLSTPASSGRKTKSASKAARTTTGSKRSRPKGTLFKDEDFDEENDENHELDDMPSMTPAKSSLKPKAASAKKPGPKPKGKPGPKPKGKPGPKPKAKPGPKPKAKPGPKPKKKPGPKPKVKATPKLKPKGKPGPKPKIKTEELETPKPKTITKRRGRKPSSTQKQLIQSIPSINLDKIKDEAEDSSSVESDMEIDSTMTPSTPRVPIDELKHLAAELTTTGKVGRTRAARKAFEEEEQLAIKQSAILAGIHASDNESVDDQSSSDNDDEEDEEESEEEILPSKKRRTLTRRRGSLGSSNLKAIATTTSMERPTAKTTATPLAVKKKSRGVKRTASGKIDRRYKGQRRVDVDDDESSDDIDNDEMDIDEESDDDNKRSKSASGKLRNTGRKSMDSKKIDKTSSDDEMEKDDVDNDDDKDNNNKISTRRSLKRRRGVSTDFNSEAPALKRSRPSSEPASPRRKESSKKTPVPLRTPKLEAKGANVKIVLLGDIDLTKFVGQKVFIRNGRHKGENGIVSKAQSGWVQVKITSGPQKDSTTSRRAHDLRIINPANINSDAASVKKMAKAAFAAKRMSDMKEKINNKNDESDMDIDEKDTSNNDISSISGNISSASSTTTDEETGGRKKTRAGGTERARAAAAAKRALMAEKRRVGWIGFRKGDEMEVPTIPVTVATTMTRKQLAAAKKAELEAPLQSEFEDPETATRHAALRSTSTLLSEGIIRPPDLTRVSSCKARGLARGSLVPLGSKVLILKGVHEGSNGVLIANALRDGSYTIRLENSTLEVRLAPSCFHVLSSKKGQTEKIPTRETRHLFGSVAKGRRSNQRSSRIQALLLRSSREKKHIPGNGNNNSANEMPSQCHPAERTRRYLERQVEKHQTEFRPNIRAFMKTLEYEQALEKDGAFPNGHGLKTSQPLIDINSCLECGALKLIGEHCWNKYCISSCIFDKKALDAKLEEVKLLIEKDENRRNEIAESEEKLRQEKKSEFEKIISRSNDSALDVVPPSNFDPSSGGETLASILKSQLNECDTLRKEAEGVKVDHIGPRLVRIVGENVVAPTAEDASNLICISESAAKLASSKSKFDVMDEINNHSNTPIPVPPPSALPTPQTPSSSMFGKVTPSSMTLATLDSSDSDLITENKSSKDYVKIEKTAENVTSDENAMDIDKEKKESETETEDNKNSKNNNSDNNNIIESKKDEVHGERVTIDSKVYMLEDVPPTPEERLRLSLNDNDCRLHAYCIAPINRIGSLPATVDPSGKIIPQHLESEGAFRWRKWPRHRSSEGHPMYDAAKALMEYHENSVDNETRTKLLSRIGKKINKAYLEKKKEFEASGISMELSHFNNDTGTSQQMDGEVDNATTAEDNVMLLCETSMKMAEGLADSSSTEMTSTNSRFQQQLGTSQAQQPSNGYTSKTGAASSNMSYMSQTSTSKYAQPMQQQHQQLNSYQHSGLVQGANRAGSSMPGHPYVPLSTANNYQQHQQHHQQSNLHIPPQGSTSTSMVVGTPAVTHINQPQVQQQQHQHQQQTMHVAAAAPTTTGMQQQQHQHQQQTQASNGHRVQMSAPPQIPYHTHQYGYAPHMGPVIMQQQQQQQQQQQVLQLTYRMLQAHQQATYGNVVPAAAVNAATPSSIVSSSAGVSGNVIQAKQGVSQPQQHQQQQQQQGQTSDGSLVIPHGTVYSQFGNFPVSSNATATSQLPRSLPSSGPQLQMPQYQFQAPMLRNSTTTVKSENGTNSMSQPQPFSNPNPSQQVQQQQPQPQLKVNPIPQTFDALANNPNMPGQNAPFGNKFQQLNYQQQQQQQQQVAQQAQQQAHHLQHFFQRRYQASEKHQPPQQPQQFQDVLKRLQSHSGHLGAVDVDTGSSGTSNSSNKEGTKSGLPFGFPPAATSSGTSSTEVSPQQIEKSTASESVSTSNASVSQAHQVQQQQVTSPKNPTITPSNKTKASLKPSSIPVNLGSSQPEAMPAGLGDYNSSVKIPRGLSMRPLPTRLVQHQHQVSYVHPPARMLMEPPHKRSNYVERTAIRMPQSVSQQQAVSAAQQNTQQQQQHPQPHQVVSQQRQQQQPQAVASQQNTQQQ
eukprot:TRINITY_DN218_c0_g2_i4.p1 TRINITY_DN218_c0_g2~~TRINITY_DN218_c0_g2_i4.p1  ORF type:complete len:2310 (-),score=905.20 TRINITY_DN218_c0_g2_i4:191-6814(-)